MCYDHSLLNQVIKHCHLFGQDIKKSWAIEEEAPFPTASSTTSNTRKRIWVAHALSSLTYKLVAFTEERRKDAQVICENFSREGDGYGES